jgi:hypothetical protein
MLAEIPVYERQTSIISNSGLQFMDFEADFQVKGLSGAFVPMAQTGPLVMLAENEQDGKYYLPDDPSTSVRPACEFDVDESLRLLEGQWLPAPVFQKRSMQQFEDGPKNWSRFRVLKVSNQEGQEVWRTTFLFDTKISDDSAQTAFLSPRERDVKAGATFALAHQSHSLGWFLDEKWINDWLLELFKELAAERLKRDEEEIEDGLKALEHQAHYLNILHLIGSQVQPPEIKLVVNQTAHNATEETRDGQMPIAVDLVLDVGNSRTCGVLIESHAQDDSGFDQRYELALRDLSQPEFTYCEPFESRIEFAQANFGKSEHSARSGRPDAFLWPTILRVGPEATRLASMRRGTEGATGLSSPKRYLWDEDKYTLSWHFNTAGVKTSREPYATAEPISGLINEVGDALFDLHRDERMPVFLPYYSRSSLMMLMLGEVLTQALTQINSITQRLKRHHSNLPRQLRNIVLTVPPSMSAPEREIMEKRMTHAIGVVWKSLGWHPWDAEIDDENAVAFPPLPKVHLQWDEATSGQAVYIYNEIFYNFGGRAEEFFKSIARPDQPARDNSNQPYISVATIDIGGGTTDLVINEYFLDQQSSDANAIQGGAVIVPEQRFRDGFRIAGDDIVLDTLRKLVAPRITHAIQKVGVDGAEALVSKLIGSEKLDAHEAMLRQQLTLQVLYPVGLQIVKRYEAYDPFKSPHSSIVSIRDLLRDKPQPSEKVLGYFNQAVNRKLKSGQEQAAGHKPFDLLDVEIDINLGRLHLEFLTGEPNICKSLASLAEIIYHYRPDVLLLTGRPSRLPGVVAFIESLQAIPVHRVISMHGYQIANGWYPFHLKGKIDDPKTTAAVGAMICLLSKDGKVKNFYFRSAKLKPYSTIRYLGRIDNNNTIADRAVYYRDIDLDDTSYELPDVHFTVPGTLPLGYRQLDTARWPASPLYTLLASEKLTTKIVSNEETVKAKLAIVRGKGKYTEKFAVHKDTENYRHLTLKLNTMAEDGSTQYWLDSGSIKS